MVPSSTIWVPVFWLILIWVGFQPLFFPWMYILPVGSSKLTRWVTNTSRRACAARYGCGFLLVTWMRYFGSWILYWSINLMLGWILYCCIYLCFKPLIYIGSIWDFIGPWKNGIWWWIIAILRWNNSEHGTHYFLHPWCPKIGGLPGFDPPMW